jgi:phage-related tail fiber protein
MTITPNPSQVDRLDGVNEGIAYKAPVRAATTAAITLSGEQTIDGVAVVELDRVLVKDQADAVDNGIYDASTGPWRRALDANGNRDFVHGSRVSVNEGSTNGSTAWRLTTDDPVTIGTDELDWGVVPGGGSVTSVAQTVPVEFTITGSPVTTSGTLAIGKATEVANTVWAGPTSGADAEPTFRALVGADIPVNVRTATLLFIIDGGGSTISTGIKGDITVGFNCLIQEVVLLADQSGSIVVDIWKTTYTGAPPLLANTITAAAKPTISSATKSRDATLTGWSTTITGGDVLRYKVDSATSITRCTVALTVVKDGTPVPPVP